MKTRNIFVPSPSNSSFAISLKDPDQFLLYNRFRLNDISTDLFVITYQDELDHYYRNNVEDINTKWKQIYDQAIIEITEKNRVVCIGYCDCNSTNIVERGLVYGGWYILSEENIDLDIHVIQDCYSGWKEMISDIMINNVVPFVQSVINDKM